MRKQGEHAQTIAIEKLVPFRAHPFLVRDDEQMRFLTESISSMGILTPAIARTLEDGTYELIAGHRRKHACELLGLPAMPVIVRDISDDAATVMMVDSNLQREVILPSEKAKAYKMKLDALKRQGARTEEIAKREGVTEAMKAADQMAWVRRMNSIRARAEEVVYAEVIYAM